MNNLTDLADVATVATAIVAVGALLLAFWQVKKNHKITREATATDLFNQSLILSLEYPELAAPAAFEEMSEIDQVRYDSFVSSMLLAAEEILSVTSQDPLWRKSVKGNLYPHAEYLVFRQNGDYPPKDYYDPALVSVIEEIISETARDIDA